MGNSMTLQVRRDGRLAVGISFFVMAAAGGLFILWRWAGRGDAIDGLLRCTTFICAMAAVHAWGSGAYWRQGMRTAGPLAHAVANVKEFRRRVSVGAILAQQGLALFLCTMVLDRGELLYKVAAAVVVYWAALAVILIARRRPLTKLDLFIAQAGFWPVATVVATGLSIVWRAKGLA